MNPAVSVIIPTYNRASFLARVLQSALEQTLQDLEVLVVDDGSTDNTQEVVRQLRQKDSRIRYFTIPHTGGAAAPKNKGIQEAKGEYVATLDADDEWLPEKLARQLALLQGTSAAFVGCDFLIIENGEETRYRVPQYQNAFDRLLEVDYMGPGSCMLYKKVVFEKLGGFDENLKSGQDKEMRLRLLSKGYELAWSPEVLVRYHKEDDGIGVAHLGLAERERDWAYVFEKYRSYYEAQPSVWSTKLRYDGTRYTLLGERKKAWQHFLSSIAKNPLNWRSFLYFALSFFGKGVYNAATKWKLNQQARRPKK